jgi:hypothetical protein
MISDYFIANEDSFRLNGIPYERDKYSRRCYRMEPSITLKKDMDGALVRRRISNALYMENYRECKTVIEAHEAWEAAAVKREQEKIKEYNQEKNKCGQGSHRVPAEKTVTRTISANKKQELKLEKKYSLFK